MLFLQTTKDFSKPIGAVSVVEQCHRLRLVNENKSWRIIYSIVSDANVIREIFEKKSEKTPTNVVDNCKRRLRSSCWKNHSANSDYA